MIVIPACEAVAFNLFSIPVYWYGICMACAIFMAIIVANSLLNRQYPSHGKDIIIAESPIVIIAGILGARLYFCLLNFSYYSLHPLEILDIREGGLSVHGGLIFGILALLWVARKYKIPFLKLLDVMGVATILGQSVGRWGNYFNSEAYGLPVSGQHWGLFIPQERRIAEFANYSLFHPTFLYESILDFLSFCVLLFIYLKLGKRYSGFVFFTYLILYSVIRFFVEKIRVDSAFNIGVIPIAEVVSVVLFVVGCIGLCYVILKNRK